MNASDIARNSYGCWELAVACLREIRVRSGEYEPKTDEERQQRLQGPCRPSELDTVKA